MKKNHLKKPTSILGAVPTYQPDDLPTINGVASRHADAPGMLGFADLVSLLGDAPGILGFTDLALLV